MATILITGAAGFIGSHTADLLLETGHRVVGMDNFRTGRRENLAAALAHPNFVLRQADAAEPAAWDALAAEFPFDAIIHLAALVGVQESFADPILNHRLNVETTQIAAETARRHRVPRLVYASSAAVYGDATQRGALRPISPYGTAKLTSETFLLGRAAGAGLTVRCQRYFNVYGPRQDPGSPYSGVISIFARCGREGRQATLFGDGAQTRDFVSVHDAARANLLAATKPGLVSGAADIATGREVSLLRLLELMAERFPGMPPPRFAPARSGDIRRSFGDPAPALEQLGFAARWSLEEGLAELCRL